MKNSFIVLTISLLAFNSFGQSTTLLPNSVGVPNLSAMPTCDVNAKGKQVFNTNDNKMYFCNGTSWTDMTVGGFTLPYSGSGSASAPNILFKISNSTNGRAITGETSSPTYGIGVYGASSNTAPSSVNPSTIGVFGINNSQNSNGVGIYGQHDGTGKGIYGVVKNDGIGVHGLGLPVSSGGNGGGIGVKGESTSAYGVYGISSNAGGVKGFSTNSYGIVGESTNGIAGYFYNNGPASTLYVENYGNFRGASIYNSSNSFRTIKVENGGTGGAAEFFGDVFMNKNLSVNTISTSSSVAVGNNLTVNNGKGVAYNATSSTNLKIHRFSSTYIHAVLPAHGSSVTSDGNTIVIDFSAGNFTNTPTVYVGDINLSGGSTGEIHRVILQLFDCNTNSCSAKIINTDNTAVDYSVRWNIIAIGN